MESLTDRFARKLNYVRISLTDRCNYRCTYCMPPQGVPFLDHQRILRYEEILFLCRVLFQMGVRRVRFTGGEPLVRRGLLPFLEQLRGELPELRLALTTNASLLAPHVPRLAALRLDSLNVSLDTLDPGRFRELTRLGNLEDVLGGLDAAREAGIRPIKLNAVLVRGQNDQEVPRLLDFAHERGFLLRLIEFMPLEEQRWSSEAFLGADEILRSLPGQPHWEPLDSGDDPVRGPARYYRHGPSGRILGIIAAVSHHFCESCNRLRITPTGELKTCLFSRKDTDLRPFLQQMDEVGLEEALRGAVREKPRCWEDIQDGKLHMSHIGG